MVFPMGFLPERVQEEVISSLSSPSGSQDTEAYLGSGFGGPSPGYPKPGKGERKKNYFLLD